MTGQVARGGGGGGGGGQEESDGFWSFLPDADPGSDDRPTATQLLGAEHGVSDQQQREMDEQIGIERETEAAQAAGPRQDTAPESLRNLGDRFEENVEDAVPGAGELKMLGFALLGLVGVVAAGVALYLLRPVLTIISKAVG